MNTLRLDITDLEPSLRQSVSSEIANHYKIIPKAFEKESISFYSDETQKQKEIEIRGELELIFDKKVEIIFIASDDINKSLSINYRENKRSNSNQVSEGSFIEDLIFEAESIGASDIHLEVFEKSVRIRLRIDGQLIERNFLEKENYLEVINQIKIKSNLDITEKRLPQDGRIEYENFDLRISILPTHYGEKVVMRILGRDASHLNLDKLGLEDFEFREYLDSVRKSFGLVLISGPTGSGKTTTLYATLKHLNDIKRNIVTVEDPIEYVLEGINQVQLKEDIGLNFTKALRSFLRQDPDIIMLGEIRDGETAQMAIRASLTGHLVLSTIHTNSAIGTVSRLIDMGVPGFLIAETLNISVAQRLLRTLCTYCKEIRNLNRDDLPSMYHNKDLPQNHFVPKGCDKCYHTGFNGRKAIYEVLPITNEVIKLIKSGNIESYSYQDRKNLAEKAFDLFKNGETSLDEIYPILINL